MVLFVLWLFAEVDSSLLFVVAIGLLQMILSITWLVGWFFRAGYVQNGSLCFMAFCWWI